MEAGAVHPSEEMEMERLQPAPEDLVFRAVHLYPGPAPHAASNRYAAPPFQICAALQENGRIGCVRCAVLRFIWQMLKN